MGNKQFMVDDCGTLINMETRDTYDYVSDIVDLLNEYEFTIKQYESLVKLLKEQNEKLKKDLLELHEICAYYESRIKELKGDDGNDISST